MNFFDVFNFKGLTVTCLIQGYSNRMRFRDAITLKIGNFPLRFVHIF